MAGPKIQTKKTKKVAANQLDRPSSRKLKRPLHRSFRLEKRLKHPAAPLQNSFRIFGRSLQHIWRYKKIFGLVTLAYALLTLVFVKSFSLGTNLTAIKSLLQTLFNGGGKNLSTSLSLFGYLVGTTGSSASDVASVYQSVLLIIMSLVFIWVLRQTYAKDKVSVLQAFYRSQYPLIPFILILAVIALQLVPLAIANSLYSFIFGNGLAVSLLEKAIWLIALFLLALLSLYMVTSSIFALYIVTLPDLTPIKALKSARELVRYRRWTVMRKVVFLPMALLVILAVLAIPVIMFLTFAAQWVFFLLTSAGLLLIHAYMYTLYRELL